MPVPRHADALIAPLRYRPLMTDAAPERLYGLDLIRGLAVMGIALMNVASFALPPAAYGNPVAYGMPSPLDLLVWSIEFIFVDGKLRALFSILFGASLLLVTDREDAHGRRPARLHLRRMIGLLAIGLVHALLIWPGDILVTYATVGLAAYPMRAKPVPALLVAGILCLVGQLLASAATVSDMLSLRDAAMMPDATRLSAAAWAELQRVIGRGDGSAAAESITLHLGSYADVVGTHLAHAWSERTDQLASAGIETLGFVLIGMAGLRSGLLAGAWPRSTYRRIAIGTIGGGAVAGMALLVACFASGFDPILVYAAAVVGGAPLRPIMAVGYACAALLVAGGALSARIRAAGRMALSCYIGTSILFALLFDGYGLGLFGRLPRAQLLLPVLIVWALMLALCPRWLRHFRHGPVEWLWRSAARGSFQAMRR